MKYLILLFLLSCQLKYIKAQYSFTTQMTTYQELNNPISLDQGQIWNEGSTFQIYFNFNFHINGQAYTALNVTAGGGIDFPGLGQKQLFVFHTPFGGYLLKDRNPTDSTSSIDYEVIGTTGQQILKIQWKNAGFVQWYSESDTNDYVDFQVWLFEQDNHIEVHFGNNSTNPGTYGYPSSTSDPNPGASFKFLFDNCNNMFGLQGAANLPSYWFFNSCIPNYTFIDGTPSNGITYVINPTSTGISDSEKINFSIYPNPASDYIHISDISQFIHLKRIQIKDLLGQCILNLKENEIDSSDIKISLDGIPQGVYIISISGQNNELITKKFIKKSY